METLLANTAAPHRVTKKIQFSILGPDEILKQSVTKDGIIYPEAMEGGKPKEGGVMDPRQGVIDKNSRCVTCDGKMHECPGHFGHVSLNRPVFYGHYLGDVIKILRCICWSCSKLRVHLSNANVKKIQQETRRNMKSRKLLMLELCKGVKVCDARPDPVKPDEEVKSEGCGRPQLRRISRAGLDLTANFYKAIDESGETTMKLPAEKVLEILKAMDDQTIEALGFSVKFSRPEWMIATVVPVLPLCVRPSVLSFGTTRCQDDLTHKLADIVKANNQLKENEENGMANHIVEENVKLLQYHVNTLFDNSMPGVPKATQKSGRPLKSIKQRVSGKEGRVRGNLMGKRVDFCGRTVITPDPTISIDEVGVPRAIAQTLTFPEIVTPYNIDELQRLVANGPDHYPGACYLVRENNERVNLRLHPKTSNIHLRTGYKVERHLRDGDLVVFNRQPSLHKMSMMCHRVKVMPGLTFRLNLSVTAPYNADFDGDEMNLHLPQTIEARAEISQLSSVARMIVTPQCNKPVMGIVQDTLTGAYKMTSRSEFITKDNLMNLLHHLPSWDGVIPQPAILKPVPLWTGKQLFSAIIPGKVNCMKNSDAEDKWTTPNDVTVLVENGELLSGILCKKTLGASEGSLMHVVYLEEGFEKAAAFYADIQLVVNQWLLLCGHTVGLADMIAEPEAAEKFKSHIADAKENVKNLENKGNRQSYEQEVNKLLNGARDNIGEQVIKSLSRYNNFKNMVAAGSKGNNSNISQIMACVGQQNVEGRRIPFGYAKRSSPHFTQNDHGPRARGFVENSYIVGLTPSEFVFHAMAGREGIIDTAIKTSETGYIQRRLIKAMESLQVGYDSTVRNQNDQIIQLTYGEDGLAGEWVETQNLISLDLDRKQYEDKFMVDFGKDRKKLKKLLEGSVLGELDSDLSAADEFQAEYEQLLSDRLELERIFPSGIDRLVLPCNLKRMIWNAQKTFRVKNRPKIDLNPLRVINDVRNLCDKFKIVKGYDDLSSSANANATLLMNILLRSTLSSKRVLDEFHLSSEAFDWLVGEIEARYTLSQVQPGEMVGVLAAQSIGEPATQMTLNTFHHAGISSKNITLGVPRLKEIINVSKNPKCPSVTIFLDEETAFDKDKAHDIMNDITHTTLDDLTISSDIIYEPADDGTTVPEDEELVDVWREMATIDSRKLSAHMLRMKLDPIKMYDHGKMSASYVEDKMAELFDREMDVASCDEESVLRIRLLERAQDSTDEEPECQMPDSMFLARLNTSLRHDMPLKGIKSIKSVQLCQANKSHAREIKRMNGEGKYDRPNHLYLETEGTALAEVLRTPCVDAEATVSNDVVEIGSVLGIEAAKKAIEKELTAVLNFYGSYVNHRHMAILCDVMTNKGILMAISRHGINKQETGPIALATFEQTMDILVEAAAHAELDPLKGVSESIMLGKFAKIGTGNFDVLLDEDKCEMVLETPEESSIFDRGASIFGEMTGMTPKHSAATPLWKGAMSPNLGGFSPIDTFSSPGYSPAWSPSASPWGGPGASPGLATPSSPGYDPLSRMGLASPSYQGLASPSYTPVDGLTSPGYTPTSPGHSPTSPKYSPTSPQYTPTSPQYTPTSPQYTPTSPNAYSPTTPGYSASSPAYNSRSPGYTAISPGYSPSSPPQSPPKHSYSPSPVSPPASGARRNPTYASSYSPSSPSSSPTTPRYSPVYPSSSPVSSPKYSPSSPLYSPTSPGYSPTSPGYSPTSPGYSPTSPGYSPTSQGYTPTSPSYTPTSPAYGQTSPVYTPNSPGYTPNRPGYSPTSPGYSPTSPAYTPTSPAYTPTSPAFDPSNSG